MNYGKLRALLRWDWPGLLRGPPSVYRQHTHTHSTTLSPPARSLRLPTTPLPSTILTAEPRARHHTGLSPKKLVCAQSERSAISRRASTTTLRALHGPWKDHLQSRVVFRRAYNTQTRARVLLLLLPAPYAQCTECVCVVISVCDHL